MPDAPLGCHNRPDRQFARDAAGFGAISPQDGMFQPIGSPRRVLAFPQDANSEFSFRSSPEEAA
jgi:hypothetical protein